MAKMTLKEALESDEVRGYMNDVIEHEVSKALISRGLGTGAGRRAALETLAAMEAERPLRVSESARVVMDKYWPGLGEEPSAMVEPSEADEPVEVSEPVDPGVVEVDSAPLYSEEAVAARPELGSVGGRPSMGVVESGRLPERLARMDERTRGALGLDGAA